MFWLSRIKNVSKTSAGLKRMKSCEKCHNPIPPDRLIFLIETNRPLVCLDCSQEKPKIVLMEYGHKTAGYPVVVGSDPESQRIAFRAFKRAR